MIRNFRTRIVDKPWFGPFLHRRMAFVLVCASFALAACEDDKEMAPIELPATPALVMQTTWAVVTSSHLRLRESPSTDSTAVATLWQGSVLEIISKTSSKEIVEDQEDFWYQIDYDGLGGWVFGSYLQTYDSKEHAEESARELRR